MVPDIVRHAKTIHRVEAIAGLKDDLAQAGLPHKIVRRICLVILNPSSNHAPAQAVRCVIFV